MRILLAEDNQYLGEAIQSHLRGKGHVVDWDVDGDDVLGAVIDNTFDAVALDLILPNQTGISLIGELRRLGFDAPILVMTARSEIDDKVGLLDLGADDYLVKPFDLRELEARLRALIRRTCGHATSTFRIGNVEMDLAGLQASAAGVAIVLGRREFRLLKILVTNAGHIVPKERLMNQLFNFDEDVSMNALELHISRLRKKLEPANIEIATVRGVGYLAGQTAGFLFAYLPMAFLIGWAAEKGAASRPLVLLASLLIADALMMLSGFAWLLMFAGSTSWIDQANPVASAWGAAVEPFLVWDALKMAMAAMLAWQAKSILGAARAKSH